MDVHRDVWRPVAVVALIDSIRRIRVVSRTTDLDEPGVAHDRAPEIGLTQPGVFARQWVQLLDQNYFKPPLVRFLARLDDATWTQITDMVNSR